MAPGAVLEILVQSRQLTRSLSGTGHDNDEYDAYYNADNGIEDILSMSCSDQREEFVKLRMVSLRILRMLRIYTG